MTTSTEPEPDLDPDAPGLDEDTRARRRVLAEMKLMTREEKIQSLKDAGILTEDGELAPQYRDDAEPSACRPTD